MRKFFLLILLVYIIFFSSCGYFEGKKFDEFAQKYGAIELDQKNMIFTIDLQKNLPGKRIIFKAYLEDVFQKGDTIMAKFVNYIGIREFFYYLAIGAKFPFREIDPDDELTIISDISSVSEFDNGNLDYDVNRNEEMYIYSTGAATMVIGKLVDYY